MVTQIRSPSSVSYGYRSRSFLAFSKHFTDKEFEKIAYETEKKPLSRVSSLFHKRSFQSRQTVPSYPATEPSHVSQPGP